jgi:hypothetical protein
LGTGQNISRTSDMSQQFFIAALICSLPYFFAYLVLSVSKQVGRYLSNRMVRLAFSVWTSLWSIQLLTGGFHPRSAGLIYRIPGSTGKIVQ